MYTVIRVYPVQIFFVISFHSLKELYFLECDVGQSEFTPPGLISLNRVCTPLLGRLQFYQRIISMASLMANIYTVPELYM